MAFRPLVRDGKVVAVLEVCILHHVDYAHATVAIEASCGLPDALRGIDGFPLHSSRWDEAILKRQPAMDGEAGALVGVGCRVRQGSAAVGVEVPVGKPALEAGVEDQVAGDRWVAMAERRGPDGPGVDKGAGNVGRQTESAGDAAAAGRAIGVSGGGGVAAEGRLGNLIVARHQVDEGLLPVGRRCVTGRCHSDDCMGR
jgi:hypothetical protein